MLNGPPRFLRTEARDGWKVGENVDEREGVVLDGCHPEIDLSQTPHTDFREGPTCCIPATSTHPAIDNTGPIIEFMVRGIEFFSVFRQILKYFKGKFIDTEHVEYPLYHRTYPSKR
jgi:hypothetical protein